MRTFVILTICLILNYISLVSGASGGILEFLDLNFWKSRPRKDSDREKLGSVSEPQKNNVEASEPLSNAAKSKDSAVQFVDLAEKGNLRKSAPADAADLVKAPVKNAQKVEFVELTSSSTTKAAEKKPAGSTAANSKDAVEFLDVSAKSKPVASDTDKVATQASIPKKAAPASAKKIDFVDLSPQDASPKSTTSTQPASVKVSPDNKVEFLDLSKTKTAAATTPAAQSAAEKKATGELQLLDAVKQSKSMPLSAASKALESTMNKVAAAKGNVEFLDASSTKAASSSAPATVVDATSATKPTPKLSNQVETENGKKAVEFVDLTATTPAAKAAAPAEVTPAATTPATSAKKVDFVDLAPTSASPAVAKPAPATPSAAAKAQKVDFVELAPTEVKKKVTATDARRLDAVQFLDLNAVGANTKKEKIRENKEAVEEKKEVEKAKAEKVESVAEKKDEQAVKNEKVEEVQFLEIAPAKKVDKDVKEAQTGQKEGQKEEVKAEVGKVADSTPKAEADAQAKPAVTKETKDEVQFLELAPATGKKNEAAEKEKVVEQEEKKVVEKKDANKDLQFLEVAPAKKEEKGVEAVTEGKEVKEEKKEGENIVTNMVKSTVTDAVQKIEKEQADAVDEKKVEKDAKDVENKESAKESANSTSSTPTAGDAIPVLITGINDAVGANIAKLLLSTSSKKYAVYGIVYSPPQSSLLPTPSTYSSLLPYITLLPVDILDTAGMYDVISSIKPALVFHCAQLQHTPGGDFSTQISSKMMAVNIDSTTNLLEGVKRAQLGNATRVYVSGSYLEYGKAAAQYKDNLIPETASPDPYSAFGISKYTAEKLALRYFEEYEVQVIVGRQFPILGKDKDIVQDVQHYCKQIAMVENGLQTALLKHVNVNSVRDLLDAQDAAAAIVSATLQGQAGQVYNIARGQGVRVKDLVSKLISLSNAKKIEMEEVTSEGTGFTSLVADVTKLADLQFKPKVSIADTLQQELDFWRDVVKTFYVAK